MAVNTTWFPSVTAFVLILLALTIPPGPVALITGALTDAAMTLCVEEVGFDMTATVHKLFHMKGHHIKKNFKGDGRNFISAERRDEQQASWTGTDRGWCT